MPLTEWVVSEEKDWSGPRFMLGPSCWHIEKRRTGEGCSAGALCGAYLTEFYGGNQGDVTRSEIDVCRNCQRVAKAYIGIHSGPLNENESQLETP